MGGASPRAVVVGAGLAGLAAAHRLQRCGVPVLLLEARAQPGGSCGAKSAAGLELALPAVVPRSAPHLAALHREVTGAELARSALDRVAAPGPRGVELRPLSTRAALGRGPLARARLVRLQAVLERLGARIDAARPEHETRLDDRSVTDLCRLYPGARASSLLFAPLLAGAFGLDASDTSRLLLMAWMNAAGEVELSLADGLPALCDALARSLVELWVETRVERVLPGGRGVVLGSGESIEADAVVLAVGAQEVLRLVPDLGHVERELLGACGTRVQSWLALALSVPARPPARLAWPGPPATALLDATPPDAGGASLLVLRASGPADPARLIAAAERVVPGLAAHLREQHACSSSAPTFGVGHFRRIARLRAEARRRPSRRLYLCGDYLIGPDAEAAIASGERAARHVLAQLV